MSDVICDEVSGQHGHLGRITLNRSRALNALSYEMFEVIDRYLTMWAASPDIKAVIICSNSPRAFSAGGDIRHLYHNRNHGVDHLIEFFQLEYAINRRIFHYPKPYIAFLQGLTMGGGVGLSLHGSHPIATSDLIFAMPETGIGFFPDVGGSYFLSRLPDHVGIYLALTGDRLQAADTVALGLTPCMIDQQAIADCIDALTQAEITSSADLDHLLVPFKQKPPPSTLPEKQQFISDCFGHGTVEAIFTALQDHTDPRSQAVLKTLKQKSPTSLKVTLKQLQTGKDLSFDACMEMELCLARHFLMQHDFFEGIRALLIDKDNQPHWQPNSIGSVSPALVDAYFTAA